MATVATPEKGAEPPDLPPVRSPLRGGRGTLVVVGLLFLVVQLVLVPRPLGLATDEATYLAMVDPSVPELYWSSSRAWGVPVLAAPIAVFSPGLGVIRLYFSVLSSCLLILAFWPWLRILHPAVAPLAALLFSTTWFTVWFGPLVMPNLYVALFAVAVIGLFLRCVQDPRWWRAALVATAAALVALVRPTDSVLVIVPIFVCALVVPRLRRLGALGAVAVGELLGWLPWVMEAYARFGGPLARLRSGESAGPGGLHVSLANVQIYPRLLDGIPTYCCQRGSLADAGPLPLLPTLWLVAIPMVSAVGLLLAARQRRLPELLLVCVPAGLLAAFYLLLPSFTALRFLLPVFALLSLAVAGALVSMIQLSQGKRRKAVAAVIAVGLVAHVGPMLYKADGMLHRMGTVRTPAIRIAAAIRPLIGGRPCLLVGAAPQALGYYLGCEVQTVRRPSRRPPARVRSATARGLVRVAVLRKAPPPGSYLDDERDESIPA
ncbi:hypothetical protein GCM10009841_02280 [Microlunatus panaciterrae]|uniref:4-amino-4-deoxy-L-arabinose transferase-like glycosyltransferase n=1 Tax=Microlunatus panaciterrae TaxID=400768 RepID=A0ABS2RKK7_9ACTN|nr:hypothetical protein [Microlunatus panaciterrae]MBM7799107.1 4-amino-4-deoxy-L-arabinose transferase-like glycosyltransferase [Microlunatus panaciterrae]